MKTTYLILISIPLIFGCNSRQESMVYSEGEEITEAITPEDHVFAKKGLQDVIDSSGSVLLCEHSVLFGNVRCKAKKLMLKSATSVPPVFKTGKAVEKHSRRLQKLEAPPAGMLSFYTAEGKWISSWAIHNGMISASQKGSSGKQIRTKLSVEEIIEKYK